MFKHGTALLVAAAALIAAAPAAADQFSLDLANPPGTIRIPVSPGTEVSVLVVNRLPQARYTVIAQLESIPIDPLTPIAIPQGAACQAVTDAGTIETPTSESALGMLVGKIRDELGDPKCSPDDRAIVNRALARTVQLVPGTWRVRGGEQLTVTVTRIDDSAKKWVFVLSGGDRGTWRTLYGVSLVSDLDQHFFLKPGTATGTFVITPDRESTDRFNSLTPIPSAFFSWLPHSAELKNLSISPSLGVGVKSDRPGFFFGASITYNQNLGIVVGVPVYQQLRLKGTYSEGQVVTENLSEDQLHDKPYRFGRLFVAGVFRFGSNPFANDSKPAEKKDDSAQPAKKEDASDAKKGTGTADPKKAPQPDDKKKG